MLNHSQIHFLSFSYHGHITISVSMWLWGWWQDQGPYCNPECAMTSTTLQALGTRIVWASPHTPAILVHVFVTVHSPKGPVEVKYESESAAINKFALGRPHHKRWENHSDAWQQQMKRGFFRKTILLLGCSKIWTHNSLNLQPEAGGMGFLFNLCIDDRHK